MSLDVYLTLENAKVKNSGSGIFVRENGQTKEISRIEWNEKFPGKEPLIAIAGEDESDEVYSDNITHNLGKMASEAGIYQHLWRPDELGLNKAVQLIEPLENGLYLLESDPTRFKKLNPSNGWGDYDGLVQFTRNYLAACKQYPQAIIYVSR